MKKNHHVKAGFFMAVGFVSLILFASCTANVAPGSITAKNASEKPVSEVKPFTHPFFPLKDVQGNLITRNSSKPYSGRQTCGACHDVDRVTKDYHFQQGRTDGLGNVVMKEDYFGDGSYWNLTSGRYGIWSQATNWQTAAKHSAVPSAFGMSAFSWIRDCGGCHFGAGPGEFDRDDHRLYDEKTGRFGYELSGKEQGAVLLDGDYADLDLKTGHISPAPWDKTGLSGPDCLHCHRKERNFKGPLDMNLAWRIAALAGGVGLKDRDGNPVPAFEAAATAGQGWFSEMKTIQADYITLAEVLQIDYSVGLKDGSLLNGADDTLLFNGASLSQKSSDKVCWGCHHDYQAPAWFDGTDVHYRAFNRLNDDNPDNDIPPEESRGCITCHPGGPNHQFAKGMGFMGSQNDLAWKNFRSCRECHLTELEPGKKNHQKHPKAPAPVNPIHRQHQTGGRMMELLSCQACHMPYSTTHRNFFLEPTAGGSLWPKTGNYGRTARYVSADPLDPSNPDKSRWYPGLMFKEDSDGAKRLFPCFPWVMIYWGDWDQKGTPDDLSDDIIAPVLSWRVHQVIPEPLPEALDDDGDGKVEVNSPKEILAYIRALKGKDRYGSVVARNPVLVKGPLVWYEDPSVPEGVKAFEHEGTGIPVKWYTFLWGMDHMIPEAKEAWGSEDGRAACGHCHRSKNNGEDTKVMDRLVLVDPYDPDGRPVYKTVRDLTGVNPK